MTTTTDAVGITQLVDQHLEAYSQPDASLRDPVIARIWRSDGRLVDPPIDGTGHAGVSSLADVVATHYPGHSFRRTTAVDAHHDVARYGWELVGPDGTVAVAGLDVVTFADDGTIEQIVGFFGDLEPLPD